MVFDAGCIGYRKWTHRGGAKDPVEGVDLLLVMERSHRSINVARGAPAALRPDCTEQWGHWYYLVPAAE